MIIRLMLNEIISFISSDGEFLISELHCPDEDSSVIASFLYLGVMSGGLSNYEGMPRTIPVIRPYKTSLIGSQSLALDYFLSSLLSSWRTLVPSLSEIRDKQKSLN